MLGGVICTNVTFVSTYDICKTKKQNLDKRPKHRLNVTLRTIREKTTFASSLRTNKTKSNNQEVGDSFINIFSKIRKCTDT